MRKMADESMYSIGSRIQTVRKRANLTQEELSESIGVTPQHLSELERGLVGTSISTLVKLCTKLNVSADFILFGNSNESFVPNATLIERIQRLPKHKAAIVETGLDAILKAMDMDPEYRNYEEDS